MPKGKIDYTTSIVYKLCCKDVMITDVYVGSTTNFRQRKRTHKSSCYKENRKEYTYFVYKFIRDNGGWDNWSMIEVEKYSAIDKQDLLKRERYWLEELKATLNKAIPTRTQKEHYIDNKDKFKEYKSKYYEENKNEIIEKSKKYNIDNRDRIKKKDDISYNCDCGGKYKYSCKAKHIKSKKHQEYLNSVSDDDDE